MHFLGCLFALFLGIIFIVAVFLGSIIDFILTALGLKKRVTNNTSAFRRMDGFSHTEGQSDRPQDPTPSQGHQNEKIFKKDDSEYVDFEEIK